MKVFEFCPKCGYKHVERFDAVDNEKTMMVIGSYWYCPEDSENEGCGWSELVIEEMTGKQKVRALRKLIDQMIEEETECHRDANMHHAPGECHGLIAQGFVKRLARAFEQVGITPEEFEKAMDPMIQIEARFSGDWEPPMAYYHSCYASDLRYAK